MTVLSRTLCVATSCVALVALMTVAAFAASGSNRVYAQSEDDARLLAKVKADVAALGVGAEAQVRVKLRDGKTLKGYISQANEDSFTVANAKSGATIVVPYKTVAEARRPRGLSTRAAIFTGVGITFGSLMLLGLIFGG